MPISRRAWLLGGAGAGVLGAVALSLPGGGPRAYAGGIDPATDFAPFGTIYTPDELRRELAWLAGTMREVGAKPFAYSSEAAFEERYRRTLSDFDRPMGAGAFYLAAARLFATLNDGHVAVLLGEEYDRWRDEREGRAFPLSLTFTDYGIFVDLQTHASLPSGTRIDAIDGIPATAFIASVEGLQGAQTAAIRRALLGDYQFRQFLYATEGERSSFSINATLPDGGRAVQRVPSSTAREMREAFARSAPHGGDNYTFSRIAGDRVAYIDYRRCVDKAGFQRFLTSTFASIKQRPVRGVVIDIRSNGGGNSDVNDVLWPFVSNKPFSPGGHVTQKVSARLKREYGFWRYNLSYLPPAWLAADQTVLDLDFTPFTMIHPGPNPPRFHGPVYLLCGLHTFSSALGCAQEAKDYGLATIVGQETSPANHTGEVYEGYSPRIGVQFGFTTKYYGDPAYGPMQGVIPDVTVIPTEADIRAGRDPVLEYAVQAILQS